MFVIPKRKSMRPSLLVELVSRVRMGKADSYIIVPCSGLKYFVVYFVIKLFTNRRCGTFFLMQKKAEYARPSHSDSASTKLTRLKGVLQEEV